MLAVGSEEPQPAKTSEEEKQSVVTPERSQFAVIIKLLQASKDMEVYVEKTNQTLIQMPELHLYGLLDQRDEMISILVKEKVVLVNKVQELKELLKIK